MRVLIVAEADPAVSGSGAERVLREHVGALRRRGHSVTVLSGGASTPVREADLVIEPVGWSLAVPWRVRRVARALVPGRPDAVLLHHPYPGALLSGARWLDGTPVALVYHSPWHEEYFVRDPGRRGVTHAVLGAARRRIERAVVRRVRRVFPLSRFMAERLETLHGVGADHVRVIPGGVDVERFAPPADRAALRARLGWPVAAPVLVSLRNFEPRMGLAALLHALPAVRAVHPDARLVIGGTGALESALRTEVRTLGLDEMVRFAGFVPEPDLADFYRAADVFVLPSQALEGFGLVTLESLACGTPVLGTPVGATPELLRPLDPALVFDAPSADAIARGLLAFLARGDQEALRARCRVYAAAYTWDHVVTILEAELLAMRSR